MALAQFADGSDLSIRRAALDYAIANKQPTDTADIVVAAAKVYYTFLTKVVATP
jgi:hypothetical protein